MTNAAARDVDAQHEILLTVSAAVKDYPGQRALDNMDFSLRAGIAYEIDLGEMGTLTPEVLCPWEPDLTREEVQRRIDEPGGMTRTVDRLVEVAGPDRLRLVHANDSMDVRGAFKDRHQRIGEGHLGVEPFRELRSRFRAWATTCKSYFTQRLAVI